MNKIMISIAIGFLLSACLSSDPLNISGTINASMVLKFEAVEPESIVTLSSPGGDVNAAMRIAEIIHRNNLRLNITDRCMSACADPIMTASNSVVLGPRAIIAFHANDLLFDALAATNGTRQTDCSSRRAVIQRTYYEENSFRDISNEISERLVVKEYIPQSAPTKCDAMVDLTHDAWIPTSKQLSDLWGLGVENMICADDVECARDRLPDVFRGKNVILGDTPVSY